MKLQEKLSFFQNMINCCHNLYFWSYDENQNLIYSTFPEEWQIHTAFFMGKQQDFLKSYGTADSKPIIIGNEYNLLWIAVPEKINDNFQHIHVMGPFFTSDYPVKEIKAHLDTLQLSISVTKKFCDFLKNLPIISLTRIFEYAIMFYYCITGEKITVSDIRYQESKETHSQEPMDGNETEFHGTYEAEQEMLRMVREGDLNYREHMDKMSMTGKTGKLSNGDSIRQLKNTVLVCVILFSRAAIEGGLSPETSLSLTDNYFQNIEACSSMSELMEISHTMQADFIGRVHKCRQNSRYSQEIRSCTEYIDYHLEEEITLSILSHATGYAEYYLSKKFKKETGLHIKDYIRNKRMERAKFLLDHTKETVQEIGSRLQFCSQSYFTETFHKETGMTPTEYRTRTIS